MERRWNLATLMGLALLFLASTTAAADTNPVQEQETIPGAVPGKKFCFSSVVDTNWIGQIVLSQQPSSYEPQFYTEPGDSYDILHEEYCFDLWYDKSGETTDVLSYLSSINNGDGLQNISLQLGTDIDFGGVNTSGSACSASFMPIPYLRYGSFFGDGHTIKNLCYIADEPSSGVGFFSEAIDGAFYDLKFENVYFKVTSDDPSYSVPVGVVTGSVGYTEYGSSFRNINLKDVKIVASRAGGLTGLAEGGAPRIRNISGENIEIVATTGVIPNSVSPGASVTGMGIYLGGLVGIADAGVYVENAGITGLDVHSDFDFYTKEEPPPCASSMAAVEERVGGLVGIAQNGPVAISNTYTVGNISIPSGALDSAGKGKIGFLAGYVALNTNEGYIFGNNYHYGESDYLAKDLLGYISIDNISYGTDSWITVSVNSRFKPGGHNYRNAINKYFSPTTDLVPPNYQLALLDYSNYGGYLSAQNMKIDDFAINLNNRIEMLKEHNFYDSETFVLWSRKDGVNNGLPVFANKSLKPFYLISFMVSEEAYSSLSSTDKQSWAKAGVEVNSDGAFISMYTDCSGKITNSSWMKAATAVIGDSRYWSYYNEDAGKNVPFALKTSTVFNSNMELSLASRTTVVVRHGFVESTDEDTFYSLDEYPTYISDDVYFMGTPAKTISSDSVWTRIPYLATYSYGEYGYYGFRLARKLCIDDVCRYETIQTDGTGKFYVDALPQLSNGDTLYVVYDDSYTTYDEDTDHSAPGGFMFVSDLHGGRFDSGVANVQAFGANIDGERELYSDYIDLLIDTLPTPRSLTEMLGLFNELSVPVPYSPYLKADYPSTTWDNVDNIVALVVVGYVSSSSAKAWMKEVISTLASPFYDYSFPTDTLSALESPATILGEIKANDSQTLRYVRYVRLNKNGELDLTNLMAALEFAKENYQYEYPIYVGFLPKISDVVYRVTFDANYNPYYRPPYIATEWKNKKKLEGTYTKENANESFFNANEWYVFRTDACYNGYWSNDSYFSDFEIANFNQLEVMDSSYYTVNKDGSRSMTLYAGWETNIDYCEEVDAGYRVTYDEHENRIWNNRIIKDNSDLGNIVLQQVWMGDTLEHKSESLDEGVTGVYVPYADMNSFTFQVYAEGYPGYELDGDIKFRYMDYSRPTGDSDGSLTTRKIKEGDTLTITPEMYEDMEFFADYTFKKFNIEFVTLKKDVLYGENSSATGTYRLKSEADTIDLPKWVYTEEQCVVGWTVHHEYMEQDEPIWEGGDADWNPDCIDDPHCEYNKPDNWAVSFDVFDFALSDELDRQVGKRAEWYPMYASWVDAPVCVKELGYKQAKLAVAENGLVEFKELLRDSTGKVVGSQVHKFAKDSTMLLPSGVKGSNFVVRGAPSKGYVLDSLIMILNGKTSVYHEGDTLKGSIAAATFKAYFMPENPVPAKFAQAELLQSGSAVQFKYATNEFAASGAAVKIILEDDDGKIVVDTVIKISKTPYEGSWEHFPLRAGTYLLTATVSNSRSSDLFEKDFEVKSTIVSKADGWQMLSLSNVIMDSVTWDDDIRFYWWDDSKNYGTFWRYQRLMEEDEVDYLTGYWYSSLKGRPLVMHKDMNPPKGSVVWSMDSVYTGWNMVANPYGWYVDLYGENQDKKVSGTEQSDVEFWSWNDSLGAYEEVDVVGPYEAVWAKVKGPSKWKLPSKPAFVAKVDEDGNDSLMEPLKKTVKLASNGKNSWAIRAILRDAKGKRDGWNIMGVSESGWSSEEPPSGMGDHVNLSIKDGNRLLAKSFKKAAGDSYEWTISLDASGDRTGYLHFEGLENLRADGLKVFVTVDGTTTQMAENDTLKVAIGSLAKTATVRVAPTARTVVAQKLNGLRAFQSGNALQVGFQVSEGLAGSRAYVEILDMNGKVLSSVSGTAVSGSNSMTLQAPKSGLYMVRVRVGSKQAAGSIAVK